MISHVPVFPRDRYERAGIAPGDVDAAQAAFDLLAMSLQRDEVQRIAALSDEDLYAEVLVATSIPEEVLAWVGVDKDRAESAYRAEAAGEQRAQLLADLAAIIGEPAPVPPLPTPYIRAVEKGAPSGVAELDAAGKLPASRVPNLAGTYLTPAGGDARYLTPAQGDAAYTSPAEAAAAGESALQDAIAAGEVLTPAAGNATYARPAGAWQADAAYAVNSVVNYNGGTYRAPGDLAAAAAFDPADWEEWSPQPSPVTPQPDLSAMASISDLMASNNYGILTQTISATNAFPVFIAPFPCKVVAASLGMWNTGSIAASDTNYWTVQIRQVRADVSAVIAAKTTQATGGQAVTGRRREWNFDLATFDPANQELLKGDAVDVAFLPTGAPTPWQCPVVATVRYEPL